MTPRVAAHPLQLVLGLTAWALWFCVVYGGVSLACSPQLLAWMPVPAVPLAVLGGLSLLTAAALAWAAFACWRAAPPAPDAGHFVARVAAALHGIAAGSTLFVALPLLWVPPCV